MTTTTCTHGTTQAFCWDDATPEQRREYDELHRHSYQWAHDRIDLLGHDGGRNQAEAYATYVADTYFADPEDTGTHARMWDDFTATEREVAA